MRAEKQYLIAEIDSHLKKSDYLILANFTGATVADVAELRSRLAAEKAEFHVVKNSSLRVAAQALGLPGLDHALTGPTAVVVGGKNSAGVAKILKQFFKDKQVEQLADMPSLEVLRSQFLGLLNQPASMFVRVINATPQGLVNVLSAKVRAAEAS
jgi:large subunit ribosomal protein L10